LVPGWTSRQSLSGVPLLVNCARHAGLIARALSTRVIARSE
jgi:hypothetical protein